MYYLEKDSFGQGVRGLALMYRAHSSEGETETMYLGSFCEATLQFSSSDSISLNVDDCKTIIHYDEEIKNRGFNDVYEHSPAPEDEM